MKYLHTMLRVSNLSDNIDFWQKLGFRETRRIVNEQAGFTLVFMAPEGGEETPIELTYNHEPETPNESRYFGHLAYEVDDIYTLCAQLMAQGITINRPPRDGRMAFIRSPDHHSVELLQKGGAKEPQEPWLSMPNSGNW